MKQQDGLIRRVEDYNLIEEVPKIHGGKIKTFYEKCRERHKKKKRLTGEYLKKNQLPADLLR